LKKIKKANLKLNRRELLIGGASIGAMAISSKDIFAKELNSKNLPPNVPEWTAELGDVLMLTLMECHLSLRIMLLEGMLSG
jgi:hypothetical protein